MNKNNAETSELDLRIENFNRDLISLQKKYRLVLVAEIVHPSPTGTPSPITSVPITVKPMDPIKKLDPRDFQEKEFKVPE